MLAEFLNQVKKAIAKDTFVRITLSANRVKAGSYKKAIFKLALIKKKIRFSVVHRYQTKDITKNYTLVEGQTLIEELLNKTFSVATLFTTEKDWVLSSQRNKMHVNKEDIGKNRYVLKTQGATFAQLPEKSHDKAKSAVASSQQYLTDLGVLNASGRVAKDKGDKLKQINKFVEIIDHLLEKHRTYIESYINQNNKSGKTFRVLDMGSGKGYLTFALYDYLQQTLKLNIQMTGVEIRPDLIKLCNKIAKDNNFNQLNFEEGYINNYKIQSVDMLIALHACDTATDDAIHQGIQAGAEFIICAPCCHKQIRKALQPQEPFSFMTSHGILKERQSEILTDTIRALLLESKGYKTKVFEFISTEHTGKNVMIIAEKREAEVDVQPFLKRVKELKRVFGVKEHYLESLFS